MRKSLAITALAVLAAFVVPASATATPSTPRAATARADVFRGDVNGDRIADQVTLGADQVSPTCSIKVAYGRAGGGFGTPVESKYQSVQTHAPYCPDMGVVVDLGGDGKPEIVATGFSWDSAARAFQVLRRNSQNQIRSVATYPGVAYPSTLRKVDFTGDGREDLWVSTDQSLELRSFTNAADGGITAGNISACTRAPIPKHSFADFNGDGGQDMLLSLSCTYTTAELQFGAGKPKVTFARDDTGRSQYEVFATYQNGDEYPDVALVTTTETGTTLRHFINDGAGNFTAQ
ncbi:VCBS repeat-containing protein [Actinokineospora auranticolor]|uniref:VCBS repeat protein n=1 Tax=Actinokineospora auranticolor TaxID=155976 RepID=A0A2S6GT84_9PSEU|nr:VCBS repeat-containing protein [Actinokineospora auranticolor]PPK68434.1 hypothetical protein CLV40_105157 [Actinokineospora auranticolor]